MADFNWFFSRRNDMATYFKGAHYPEKAFPGPYPAC